MKRILFLILLTVSVYGQNPSRFAKIQITGNTNSGTATKVNVQEANGEVNSQTINTGFNKNIGLGGSDVVGATTLLNQYSTTPVDWTATAFNSGQVVFYGGKQWIAKIATVAGDVPAVSLKWEEITFEALANKTTSVDQTIIDGSTNAVSGNAVFDALTTKAPISSVHNPVTLGTANGLSLSTQVLSLGLASSGVTGALSGTDWNTFNNKVGGSGSTNFLTKWSGTNTVNASGAWRETSNRLANAVDNGVSEFQVTGQIDLKSKNTQGDGGQLGAELLTTGSSNASWTGTSFATGYTHVAGSVTTLTSTLSPVVSNLYQVAYTVTGRTAGSFTIAFGGATTAGIISSSAVGHKASTTGTLVITPTSDFNGTIVLSIKQITAGTASFVIRDNGGTIRNELRSSGTNNTAIGVNSLQNNTTGTNNTANGVVALQNNTTGTNNTANGVVALQNNTTGNNNTANGVNSLQNNTIGTNNTANGVVALQNNTTGNNNTANGVYSLQNNTIGSNNTANGESSGRTISNGSTPLTVANNSTFLGANTKALSGNSTNETVVGYNAIGDGNNTVSIGSTSVVSSRLRGRLLQGGVVDNLVDSGQFSGNVLATGFKTASGTASQFLKANGSVDSNTYLPLSGGDLSGLLKITRGGYQLSLTGSDQAAVDLYKLGTLGHRLFSDTGNFGVYDLENNVTILSIAKATREATFAGTISASPATTANQVVVKSQLDAVATSSGIWTPATNGVLSYTKSYWIKSGNVVSFTVNGNVNSSIGLSTTIALPNGFNISSPITLRNIGVSKLLSNQDVDSGVVRIAEISSTNVVSINTIATVSGTYSFSVNFTVQVQ